MKIQSTSNQTFQYHTLVKDCWMSGKLPSVTKGCYGTPLTKKNCSNEHMIPASQGGTSTEGNILLADKYLNNLRGNKPINEFLTLTQLKEYLKQFIDVVVKHKGRIFIGNRYIKAVLGIASGLNLKE